MKNQTLKNICEDIYTITGIKAVIYNAQMEVLYAHPMAMGSFCRAVRKSPARSKKCIDCDRAAFELCRRTGELCIYRCHMGLTEAAAPILDHGTVVGYLLFGQMLSEKDRPALAKRLASEPLLAALLQEMEPTEEEVICASARLMAMCTSYVHLQNAIKLPREDAAVSLADYIESNLKGDLSVPALCRRFGFSRSALYNISKKAFGRGISDYIRNRRLEAAEELLRKGTLPIGRVAEEVGLSDANYFTKLIRKRTGMTPKQLQIKK